MIYSDYYFNKQNIEFEKTDKCYMEGKYCHVVVYRKFWVAIFMRQRKLAYIDLVIPT